MSSPGDGGSKVTEEEIKEFADGFAETTEAGKPTEAREVTEEEIKKLARLVLDADEAREKAKLKEHQAKLAIYRITGLRR